MNRQLWILPFPAEENLRTISKVVRNATEQLEHEEQWGRDWLPPCNIRQIIQIDIGCNLNFDASWTGRKFSAGTERKQSVADSRDSKERF